mmetsp:Transcript_17257/g.46738  ORF Transcript_17257/g.46738 Transcript_17257/m.46738 type:complete len:81 (+) Transcript_17257:372-614(+)
MPGQSLMIPNSKKPGAICITWTPPLTCGGGLGVANQTLCEPTGKLNRLRMRRYGVAALRTQCPQTKARVKTTAAPSLVWT